MTNNDKVETSVTDQAKENALLVQKIEELTAALEHYRHIACYSKETTLRGEKKFVARDVLEKLTITNNLVGTRR
jgi:hypothetical protein